MDKRGIFCLSSLEGDEKRAETAGLRRDSRAGQSYQSCPLNAIRYMLDVPAMMPAWHGRHGSWLEAAAYHISQWGNFLQTFGFWWIRQQNLCASGIIPKKYIRLL